MGLRHRVGEWYNIKQVVIEVNDEMSGEKKQRNEECYDDERSEAIIKKEEMKPRKTG